MMRILHDFSRLAEQRGKGIMTSPRILTETYVHAILFKH